MSTLRQRLTARHPNIADFDTMINAVVVAASNEGIAVIPVNHVSELGLNDGIVQAMDDGWWPRNVPQEWRPSLLDALHWERVLESQADVEARSDEAEVDDDDDEEYDGQRDIDSDISVGANPQEPELIDLTTDSLSSELFSSDDEDDEDRDDSTYIQPSDCECSFCFAENKDDSDYDTDEEDDDEQTVVHPLIDLTSP